MSDEQIPEGYELTDMGRLVEQGRRSVDFANRVMDGECIEYYNEICPDNWTSRAQIEAICKHMPEGAGEHLDGAFGTSSHHYDEVKLTDIAIGFDAASARAHEEYEAQLQTFWGHEMTDTAIELMIWAIRSVTFPQRFSPEIEERVRRTREAREIHELKAKANET